MKAIFHKNFEYNRPKSRFSFSVKASPEPQTKPRDLIEAAIKAGVATYVPPRRKKTDTV